MNELTLAADADARAIRYLASLSERRVFPDAASINALSIFNETLPKTGKHAEDVLDLLDTYGSPGTVASNGADYFGFVIGATLPAAAAAERLMLAWDQCASSFDNSPVAATIERVAASWVLDILDLPRESNVGFGTSATACTVAALTTARRTLLERLGWDFDADGLSGAPNITVIISELAHITVKKALRILGFGMKNILIAPIDEFGRIDPDRLPILNNRTILCVQAGEVNTGEFDPFDLIIPQANAAGAWVHVDGAFGLWARASNLRHLTSGIENADSWTTDAHKWLNTPYDCAMTICRDSAALSAAMNSDAAYSSASANAQKNLTLEFSRRARGIPVWAALRSLGRDGVASLVERHHAQAVRVGEGLTEAGYEILNRIPLNQVLVRAHDDAKTVAIMKAAQASGKTWFGPTVWQGGPAFRLSVSSWRTQDQNIENLIQLLAELQARESNIDI